MISVSMKQKNEKEYFIKKFGHPFVHHVFKEKSFFFVTTKKRAHIHII